LEYYLTMPIGVNGSGTITGISVGGLPDGIVDTDMLAANAVATAKIADNAVTAAKAAGRGKILQVTGWTKTNTASYTVDEGGESAVPMSHSITPSATSSKILVMYSITMGISSTGLVALRAKVNNVNAGGVGTGDDTSDNKRYVSANHYVPDADGRATVNWHWIHSPNTTSSTTYSFSMLHWVGDSRTMYINRSHNDNNHVATHRAASTITLMEIGA
jgi:hypothetical protein